MEHNRGIKEILLLGVVVLLIVGGAMAMVGGGAWLSFAAIEERFGAGVALLSFGFVVAMLLFIGGGGFAVLIMLKSQKSFLQGLGELGDVMRGTAGVERERLRIQREGERARNQLDVIDAKRVNALADQKLRLLQDMQRQAANGPTWDRQQEDWIDADYRFDTPAAQPARPPARERKYQIRYVE